MVKFLPAIEDSEFLKVIVESQKEVSHPEYLTQSERFFVVYSQLKPMKIAQGL